jgi:uncharacterized protein (TIRG00374 family)
MDGAMFSLKSTLFWAVLLAVTLVGALWAIQHFSGGYRHFLQLAAPIGAARWSVLAVATAAFCLLDYARLYTLFRVLGVRIAPSTGLQLTCVSYFVSSLTPTAELNIPAMIFLLHQKGIPAAQTTAVAIVKTMYMTAWVCTFGVATLALRADVHLPPTVADNAPFLVAPAALLLLFFFAIILFPKAVRRWSRISAINRCADAISQMGKSMHWAHLLAHAACIAFIAVYIFIGAYLCAALGVSIDAGRAVTVFSNSLMISYLAPVPGSIGVTEVATNYLLDPNMTERGMVASTLLRFLCWYVLAIPGAAVLLNALRRALKR